MTNKDRYSESSGLPASNSYRFGYYSAILTTIITIVTFGFAMAAIPISGANCPGDCVEYPYLDTLAQFPRDFLWMPFAIRINPGLRDPYGIHSFLCSWG